MISNMPSEACQTDTVIQNKSKLYYEVGTSATSPSNIPFSATNDTS